MRAYWNLLSLVVAGLALLACTATFIVQQYEGPPLPPERVAILRLNGQEPAVLAALDGEALGFSLREQQARVHVEMQPGIHELQAGNRNDPRHRIMLMRFEAKPGAVYRIEIRDGAQPRRPLFATSVNAAGTPDRPWDAAVVQVDRDRDEPLLEVPLLPPAGQRKHGNANDQPTPPAEVPEVAAVPTAASSQPAVEGTAAPVAASPAGASAAASAAAISQAPSAALPPSPSGSPPSGAAAGSSTVTLPTPPALTPAP